jgi:hypothetical protein
VPEFTDWLAQLTAPLPPTTKRAPSKAAETSSRPPGGSAAKERPRGQDRARSQEPNGPEEEWREVHQCERNRQIGRAPDQVDRQQRRHHCGTGSAS